MRSQEQQDAEEVMSMLKAIEAAGKDLNPETASEEVKDLLRLVDEVKRGPRAAQDEGEVVTPEPGFVIKTGDGSGRKFFINLCHSAKVAAPGSWQEGKVPDNVKEALESLAAGGEGDAEALRFPLSLGDARPDQDAKGEACTSVDCIMNSDVVRQAQTYRPLKRFLIEMVMRWVEQKQSVTLDKQFKLPKMRYKGDTIHSQTIRVDRKPLVRELGEVAEDPTFPLLANKMAAHKPPRSAPKAEPKLPASTAALQNVNVASQSLAGSATVKSWASGFGFERRQARPAEAGAVLQHTVSFEGRPVEAVLLQIDVPENVARLTPEDVSVELCGNRTHVVVPGCAPLDVQVPLFVTSKGAEAIVSDNGRRLDLRLPWRPYNDVFREIKEGAHKRAAKPSVYPTEIVQME